MAWNEPGGGDDKDPWGNRGDQGPPDLDEAFKKLQNNLTEMFGGGRRGSGSGSGGTSFNANVIFMGLGIIVLIWAFMGVYAVDQAERGIVLRFGKALPGVVLPGLHWNPPIIDKVMMANVKQVRSLNNNAQMLTEDENIVKVQMSVQYHIADVSKYLLQVSEPDQTLSEATESALRHEVGSATMSDVLTSGRADLAQRVKDRIQIYMERYGTGIEVKQVIIDETAPPDEVRAAFDDVIKAREDEIRFRNEANAYANQIVPEARGQAQKVLEQAQGYEQRVVAESRGEAERFNKLYAEYKLAPAVTRERMYIDAMESVYSNTTKVMIDVKGGNNMLYLPLDKILEKSTANQGADTGAGSNTGGRTGAGSSRASRTDIIDTSTRPVRRGDSDR